MIKISLASENSSDSDKSNHSTQTKTKSVSKRQTDNRNNGASPKLGDKLLSNESPSKSAKLEQKNIENEAKTETSEKPGRVGLIIANGTKISLVSVPTVPKNKPTEEQVKEPDLPRPISFEEFKEKSQLMFEKDYYNIELKTETKKVYKIPVTF